MVMPSSGPISMPQAHAEFGLGYSLSAYYGCDSGVPTSGAITLGHLYGKGYKPYRYWELMFDSLLPGNHVTPQLYELELHEAFGGADITTPATPVSASYGTWYGSTASIVDNNTVSSWYQGQYAGDNRLGGTITIDLATPRIVKEFALFYGQGCPGNFRVTVYNDFASRRTTSFSTGVWSGWQTFRMKP
ncbi:hypothetical protein ACCQ08_04530 [Comamonas sp. SY3]|uniref:hypothetical protein n=1 Tax=Comamonas sp. SY3 TaxID=3243601 RepID=UPI003592FAAB